MKEKKHHKDEHLEIKLKQQVKTNTFVYVSIVVLAVIVGVAMTVL